MKRDEQNAFREIWRTSVDPKDKQIEASVPAFHPHVIEIERNGDSALKLDLLFLGEGYTATEQDKCQKDIPQADRGSVFLFAV
jgi:IgA Peptidase M64